MPWEKYPAPIDDLVPSPAKVYSSKKIEEIKTDLQNQHDTLADELTTFESRTDNPNAVTAHQVGAYTQAETDANDQSTLDSAKNYTDSREVVIRSDTAASDSATLVSANTYADTKETPVGSQAKVDAHANRTDNPHTVTVAQIGAETPTGAQDKVNTHANASTAHVAGQVSFSPGGFITSNNVQDVATELDADITNHINNGTHDWNKITGKPNFADPSWKGVKANTSFVPLSGNSIGDTYVVVDAGDGKGAIFVCKATTGTFDQQFDNDGDVDFATPHWDSIQGKPTLVSESGLLDAETKDGAQAKIDVLDAKKLSLTGGTMTGPITLSTDPVNSMECTTKQYVDNAAILNALLFGG